jgi:diguanylate cyclase (GGDEF)-like protein
VNSLPSAILNSIDVHVVVINHQGFIQFVNQAWENFFLSNGGDDDVDWSSLNYIDICKQAAKQGDKISSSIVKGLASVMNAQSDSFECEYPCHSPTESRWYVLRAAPLTNMSSQYVITHQNVTRNKLVETRAKQLSIEDPLTSLYNRRGLEMCFEEAFQYTTRYRSSMSFVIFDVDNFKSLNDSLGHQVGDDCLVNIAGIIRRYTRRPTDIAARIGGDEFVVVFSQMTKDKVLRAVNNIKNDVEHLLEATEQYAGVTVSAGIAFFTSGSTVFNKEMLYDRADKALYQAKKQRNHIAVFN